MDCPICGNTCNCAVASEVYTSGTSAVVHPNPFTSLEQLVAPTILPSESRTPEESQFVGSSFNPIAAPENSIQLDWNPLSEGDSLPASEQTSEDRTELWKDEVAARLQTYKAKRKTRLGSTSLRLNFESTTGNHVFLKPEYTADEDKSHEWGSEESSVEMIEDLADDPEVLMAEHDSSQRPVTENGLLPQDTLLESIAEEKKLKTDAPEETPSRAFLEPQVRQEIGKLIEFPRPSFMLPPPGELAEPVQGAPRILDVPETMLPPGPLSDIQLGPSEFHAQGEDIELPLQVASQARRILAAVLDSVLVVFSAAAFGYVAMKISPVSLLEEKHTAIAAGILIPLLLWMTYQYVFLVYSAATPGMRMSRLKIAHFDGRVVTKRMRRYRAIMLLVSICTVGLGLLWSFYDEDTLCWHDRTTNTYLSLR